MYISPSVFSVLLSGVGYCFLNLIITYHIPIGITAEIDYTFLPGKDDTAA